MAPPTSTFSAGPGFSYHSTTVSRAPQNILAGPDYPREQQAGTCGLYSLGHALAAIYHLNGPDTEEAIRLLLVAAGELGGDVSLQGEITTFHLAYQIVERYNANGTPWPIEIEPRPITPTVDTGDEWRSALGTMETDPQELIGVTMAVDSNFYEGIMDDVIDNDANGLNQASRRGMPGAFHGVGDRQVTLSDLSMGNPSVSSSHAHWITIVGISDTHLTIVDANFPQYEVRMPINEAHLLTTSLQDVSRGEYFQAVFDHIAQGNGKANGGLIDLYDEMADDRKYNSDWASLTNETDGRAIRRAIFRRSRATDMAQTVALQGLALRVTKP